MGLSGHGSLERLSWYPSWRRQVCGALCGETAKRGRARGGSREIGAALRAQARQMVHGWHRVRDGTLAPASVASSMRPIRREVERLLDAGRAGGVQTDGTGRELLKRRQAGGRRCDTPR